MCPKRECIATCPDCLTAAGEPVAQFLLTGSAGRCWYSPAPAATAASRHRVSCRQAEQAREVIAFADYWQGVAGEDPGLLVFDSKLTTHKVLGELSERGIRWLTLRERGPKLIADLAARPDSEWKRVRVERTGRYRAPEILDELVQIKGIEGPVRQLAVRNIGREQPTLLITNELERTSCSPATPSG